MTFTNFNIRFWVFIDDGRGCNNLSTKTFSSCCDEGHNNNESSVLSSVSSTLNSTNMVTSMASVAAAAAASRQWYSNKAEMIPFLSLCSRYPGGPWAGLLQQTMKEKQKGK